MTVFGLDTGAENKGIILPIWIKALELCKILVPVEQAPVFAVDVDFSSWILKWHWDDGMVHYSAHKPSRTWTFKLTKKR